MMWNPRLYAAVICVGLLARWSHRAALHKLDGEFGGLGALITFWIPIVALLGIAASMVIPVAARRWGQRGNRT